MYITGYGMRLYTIVRGKYWLCRAANFVIFIEYREMDEK